MKGEYRPFVWNYLVENGIEPTVEPEDMARIQSAKPDFIGINYYQSRVVKYIPEDTDKKRIKIEL